MIRIVGVQRNPNVEHEFVLLQNQGGLRLNLRGHVLLAERAIDGDAPEFMHIFREDVSIAAGNFVLLHSGAGSQRWMRTKDLQLVYYTFMHRDYPVWDRTLGPIHILSPHHTYAERREALLLG